VPDQEVSQISETIANTPASWSATGTTPLSPARKLIERLKAFHPHESGVAAFRNSGVITNA